MIDILISFSRHRLAFEYRLGDGENILRPVPGAQWPVPPAIYCSPKGIVIGNEALRAANSGTYNAFANYFDSLSQNFTYNAGGEERPVGELLLEAAESVFDCFFREVMFETNIRPEDYRDRLRLTLIFESNISDNERMHVLKLFKENGYGHVTAEKFRDRLAGFVRGTMLKENTAGKVLVARAEGDDLTFQLIDADADRPIVEKSYSGAGADQRRKTVEDLIWEDVCSSNPYESREQNAGPLRRAADDFFRGSDQIVLDDIVLTNGNTYRYRLNRWEIDATGGDGELRRALDDFLAENGIADRSSTLLLLRGEAARNPYFKQNLGGNFAHVVSADALLRARVMQLVAGPAPVKKEKPKTAEEEKPDDFDPQAFVAALEKNRDRYQAAGNKRLFTMFSDIIRKTKAAEEYRVNLPKKRQSPHREEIASIVQALDEYVTLCTKMKVDASAYGKALDAYRSLI